MSGRKKIKATISNIVSLKNNHEYLKEDLVRLEGQRSYDKMKKFYDAAIDKLTKEMHLLPIGHRYTGTFYIKKPYSMPTEYIKLNGSAFMREDLISWQLENFEEHGHSYLRAIYKKPNDDAKSVIKKEHAKPVYEEVAS